MRYKKFDHITFKTVDCFGKTEMNHFGTVIDIEYSKHTGEGIYVIRTNFGNIAKLTETEVD